MRIGTIFVNAWRCQFKVPDIFFISLWAVIINYSNIKCLCEIMVYQRVKLGWDILANGLCSICESDEERGKYFLALSSSHDSLLTRIITGPDSLLLQANIINISFTLWKHDFEYRFVSVHRYTRLENMSVAEANHSATVTNLHKI